MLRVLHLAKILTTAVVIASLGAPHALASGQPIFRYKAGMSGGSGSNPAPVWQTAQSLGRFLRGESVNISLQAFDHQALTYSFAAGSLPAGLSLNGNVISGTVGPGVALAPYNFTVNVTDGESVVPRLFTLVVGANSPPAWQTAAQLGSATPGTVVNQTLLATDPDGDTVEYTYGGGDFPKGLSLSGNVLSGTVAADAEGRAYEFTMYARDGKADVPRKFTFGEPGSGSPNNPPVWVTSSAGGPFAPGEYVEIPFQATDGDVGDRVTISHASGTLPGTFNVSSGILYGTVNSGAAAGTSKFTMLASDGKASVPREFDFVVAGPANGPPAWATAASVGSFVAGDTVDITVTATDPENDPISYTAGATNLPTGLTLVGNRLSGTIDWGAWNSNRSFTVTASDGTTSVSRQFTFTVQANNPPVWQTWTELGTFAPGAPINIEFAATDSNGHPVTYTSASPQIPPGLTLTLSPPRLSGTLAKPATASTYTINIDASDGYYSERRNFQLIVGNVAPEWQSTSINRTYGPGEAVDYYDLYATDPNGDAVEIGLWSGTLPGSVEYRNGGLLGYMPSNVPTDTTYKFVLYARDRDGAQSTREFELVLKHPPNTPPVWQTSSNLGSFSSSGFFRIPLSATDAESNPVTYSVVPGFGTLPTGLFISGSEIQGNLDPGVSAGTYSFRLSASDGRAPGVERDFSMTILEPNVAPVWQTAANLGSHVQGAPFDRTLIATDGNASDTVTYSRVSGAVPSGLTLTGNRIHGTISPSAGDFTYYLRMRASDGKTSTDREFTITVTRAGSPPVWQTDNDLGVFQIGRESTVLLVATDPDNDLWNSGYRHQSGTLPPGMSIWSNGTLTGTIPSGTQPSSYSFSARAYDNAGNYSDRWFYVEVAEASGPIGSVPVWDTASDLGTYERGGQIDRYLEAYDDEDGWLSSDSYELVGGELPPGIAFYYPDNPYGFVADDAPFGTYSFTVKATDSDGNTALRAFTITIVDPWGTSGTPPSFDTEADLGTAQRGQFFDRTMAASDAEDGVIYPYMFTMVGGELPPGLSFADPNRVWGTIPLDAPLGRHIFTMRVTDSDGNIAMRPFTVDVVE